MAPAFLCAALLVAQAPDAGRPTAPPPPFDRLLTDVDLGGRSLDELTLMRNTIYARAGRTFKNPKLRDYFAKQPWYRPAAAPSKLTAVDAANVRFIAAHERALLAKPISAACPPPWTAGKVRDPALAEKLASLSRKLAWNDEYGQPTSCGREVELICGPDLDGDGVPEAIVRATWRLVLNGRTCKTSGTNNDYWDVTRFFLISGNPEKQRAVAPIDFQVDEYPDKRVSVGFVRLRDGRIGVESSDTHEASDTGCESGGTTTYALERGKLRKMAARIDEPPCDAQ